MSGREAEAKQMLRYSAVVAAVVLVLSGLTAYFWGAAGILLGFFFWFPTLIRLGIDFVEWLAAREEGRETAPTRPA